MKIVFRLVTVCLPLCLMLPQFSQAGGDTGRAPYEIGEKLFERKDFNAALKYYRRALKRNDVRAHYRMGLIYENAGKFNDALEHYRRFVKLGQPDSQKDDAVRRVSAIEERLKKKTTRPTDLLEQGQILFAKGNYREAETVLLKAASQNKSNPKIHFSLGEVYMGLEEYSKAAAEYSKAKSLY